MLLDHRAFSVRISVLELGKLCVGMAIVCGACEFCVTSVLCGYRGSSYISGDRPCGECHGSRQKTNLHTHTPPLLPPLSLSLSVPPSLCIFSSIITSLHCPPMTQMLIATLGRWPSRQPTRAPPSITHSCLKRYWVIRAAFSNRMPQCWGGLRSQAASINITPLPPKTHRLPKTVLTACFPM